MICPSAIEFDKFGADELATVICDQHLRKIESIYDGLLNEVFYLCFSDTDQWFNFHPLREIINYDDWKLLLV